jgi:D-alanyl-lipoteichoic acid acyltransferase DltB (MBOAT superfamily)
MVAEISANIKEFLNPIGTELVYNPDKPILFTQYFFWVFFFAVLLIYSILYRNIRLRNNFLFIISLYFYYKCSGWFVFMLLFSIITHYYIGKGISRSESPRIRKLLVFFSVLVSMLLLSYFKYTYFFTNLFNDILGTNYKVVNYLALWSNSITGTGFDIRTILLPAGISFFTFHALSYTIDIYRLKTHPAKNIPDFGFYLAFFPQLVAGPIIRASDFIPQIYKPYQVSNREMSFALILILGGLIKKMVISDYISLNFVDRVFDSPLTYSGAENLLAVYGYSLQIYCDFSGYTDIAIGLALILGFRIPINFNSPYKALNLTDFWRRWHISLSSFLRDYLYISLGGNRKGKLRTNLNLIVTMLLGGLWHGANWRFVIWGGIHGLGLVLDKLRPNFLRFKTNAIGQFWSIFFTFQIVTLAWIFFRASDLTIVQQIFSQIFYHFHINLIPEIVIGYWKVFAILCLGFVLHWLPTKWKDSIKENFISTPVYLKIIIAVIVVLVIFQFKTSVLQPFIYFQF